jgi:diguanylate cyclase (GGDEF)-like protein
MTDYSGVPSLQKPWRATLAIKFIALAASLTAATLGLTAWISYQTYRDIYITHLKSKAQTLAGFVAAVSPDRIFSYDFSSLHIYVKELSRNEDMIYAVVLADNGEPLTSFLDRDRPVVEAAIKAVGSADAAKVAKYIAGLPDTIPITVPIMFNQQQIGTVSIGVTRSLVDQDLRQLLVWNSAGSLMIIVLLSVGIYLIFRYSVVRPIQHLMQGARRVAHGDLQEEIPLSSEDELGQLARSFNEMMTDLQGSYDQRSLALDELRRLNQTLETRVAERTQDIENVNRALERMALYDSLTGLPNRTLVNDRLEQAIKIAERTNNPFAVMLIDLDRFKEVNDSLGHQVGDELLKEVGQRLAETLRDTDSIGRLGGDEFAILLPETGVEGAVRVANKLLKALDRSVELEGMSFSVSASIGVADYPEHGTDAGTLIRHADIAMYDAKLNKTGYSLYHKEIDTHSPRRLMLMGDLRAAFHAGQLTLHYQPIIDIATGLPRGVEALARWLHPEKGFIPPDEFIPLLEQTGLVRPFAYWVIDVALAQWTAWRQAGIDVVMSVNLSMRNLQDKGFSQQLAELMRKWSVTPNALLLEITESAMMSDPDQVLNLLTHFSSMGVQIAIDDFGTGYSSLSYLKRLPVHEIKIDRSFVQDMIQDKDDAVIVRSTIDLAHNLGLKVVAEGVENAETLTLLHELGCDLAQGYHISRPGPVGSLQNFFHKVVRTD